MKLKEVRFYKRQEARKATHERKRKAHRATINRLAIKEFDKMNPEQRFGKLIPLFRKMWRDILRGKTRERIAKREAKQKEMAQKRKDGKKNS